MKSNVLIVHPDIGLAARLKQLIVSGDDASVGFADTLEYGVAELESFPHLDLCVCGLRYRDEAAQLFAIIREKFPRARLLIVNGEPYKPTIPLGPGVVMLTMPEDEGRFVKICQETFASLHGSLLGHFRLGARFRSDRWSDWYEAYDNVLKRESYVTVVHPWATPEESERFMSTASLMARAGHEHVLAVFLGGEHEGRCYISHEKWTMPDLAQLAERGEKIDARMAVRILHTVAAVLRFWDYNEIPHLPLDASHVSISPAGVVKVRNCVDPNLQFKPLQLEDMTAVASAVLALLPPLGEIPLRVRELINKIRAHPQVVFETSLGDMTVELFNDKAPLTVANFLTYVDRGAYDATVFHHVIRGFVAQGGKFNEDLSEMARIEQIPIEGANGLRNLRGTLAMAQNPEMGSSDTQFIFNLVDNALIQGGLNDHGCLVFGKIVNGIEVLDKIAETKLMTYGKYKYFPAGRIIVRRLRREVPMTVGDVEVAGRELDTQMAAEAPLPEGAHATMFGRGWAKAMTSTDRALSSVSKAILKISTSMISRK